MQNRLLFDRTELRRAGIRISNSTLLRLEKAGLFPQRVRVGLRSVAWVAAEVDAYVDHLADKREGE